MRYTKQSIQAASMSPENVQLILLALQYELTPWWRLGLKWLTWREYRKAVRSHSTYRFIKYDGMRLSDFFKGEKQ